MEISSDIGKKIRVAVRAKLQELGAHVDNELPDYIMVMIANKKSKDQMRDDLQLFLGSSTTKFTDWLHGTLEKLHSITSLARKQTAAATAALKSEPDTEKEASSAEAKDNAEPNKKLKKHHKSRKGSSKSRSKESNTKSKTGNDNEKMIAALDSSKPRGKISIKMEKVSTRASLEQQFSAKRTKEEIKLQNKTKDGRKAVKVKEEVKSPAARNDEANACIASGTNDTNITVESAPPTQTEELATNSIVKVEAKEQHDDRTHLPVSRKRKSIVESDSVKSKRKFEDSTSTKSVEGPVKRGKKHTVETTNQSTLRRETQGIVEEKISDTKKGHLDKQFNDSQEKKEMVQQKPEPILINKVSTEETVELQIDIGHEKDEFAKECAMEEKSMQESFPSSAAVSTEKVRPNHAVKDEDKTNCEALPVHVSEENQMNVGARKDKSLYEMKQQQEGDQPVATVEKTERPCLKRTSAEEISNRPLKPVDRSVIRLRSTEKRIADKAEIKSEESTPDYTPTPIKRPILNRHVNRSIKKAEAIVSSKRSVVTSTPKDLKSRRVQITSDTRTIKPLEKNRTVLQSDRSEYLPSTIEKQVDLMEDEQIPDLLEGQDDEDAMETDEIVSERCRFWPVCKNGDSCPYVHPSQPCRTFPNCTYGDKCFFIHPNCKFDARCRQPKCPYTHTVANRPTGLLLPRVPAYIPRLQRPYLRPQAPVYVPTYLQSYVEPRVTCKYLPNCTNRQCPFFHPKACRWGAQCQNQPSCPFQHPIRKPIPASSVEKYKWTRPSVMS